MTDRELIARLIKSDVVARQALAAERVENERLRDFVMRLSERIFRAHEVLGRVAERKPFIHWPADYKSAPNRSEVRDA